MLIRYIGITLVTLNCVLPCASRAIHIYHGLLLASYNMTPTQYSNTLTFKLYEPHDNRDAACEHDMLFACL